MGPHYSWLALRLIDSSFNLFIYLFRELRVLYGDRWANAHFAAETLGCYAVLILPLAVRVIQSISRRWRSDTKREI